MLPSSLRNAGGREHNYGDKMSKCPLLLFALRLCGVEIFTFYFCRAGLKLGSKKRSSGCWNMTAGICSYSDTSVRHWCWAMRSGPQSAFQFIPNVFSGVQVWFLCGSVKFFPNRDNQIFLSRSHFVHRRKDPFWVFTVKSEVECHCML